MSKQRLAGVIGFPISHSLSPHIHGFWIKELQIPDAKYQAFEVVPGKLSEFLQDAQARGCRASMSRCRTRRK